MTASLACARILGLARATAAIEEEGGMHMANPTRRWTIEELYTLPDDGNKYELIRGQLFVTPAPTDGHETICARLSRILDRYVEANNLGYVFHPRSVVRIGDDTEVEPDLMVRQVQDDPDASWTGAPLPILIVEVASDSTRRRDRMIKRPVYIEAGIAEYWMVDGDTRTICVVRHDRDDVIARETVVWQPDGVFAPLIVALDDVFGPPRVATQAS